MRVVVVGLGVQGKKRVHFAGPDCVATVDPYRPEATYKQLQDVPLSFFDAALVCTPDDAKLALLDYLLNHGKHLLVEKPLLAPSQETLESLQAVAKKKNLTCYTAYNHRFEPHFVRMKQLLDSGKLGSLYSLRLFYGNGTARDVRNSPWRDRGAGVLPDLGSHLLDTLLFWFGKPLPSLQVIRCHRFENQSPDHILLCSEESLPALSLEMTLLSWKNHFTCDLIGEKGSAHIESLCKWGPTTFTFRSRKLPSGKPDEEAITLLQPDPTWEKEYLCFKQLCKKGESNLAQDCLINTALQELTLGIGALV